MKKIKMLCMLFLCLMMVFFIGIPTNANVIEVDKPVEPKKFTIQEIDSDKPVYHINEPIIFMIKLEGLSSKDISNINYLDVSMDMNYGTFKYKFYLDENIGKDIFRETFFIKSEGVYKFAISNINIILNEGNDKYNFDKSYSEYSSKFSKKYI